MIIHICMTQWLYSMYLRWSSNVYTRCDRVTRLHNTIVKYIFSKYFNVNNDSFKPVKLLKFPDIHKIKVSIYMFRIVQMNSIPSLERSLSRSLVWTVILVIRMETDVETPGYTFPTSWEHTDELQTSVL